jgi:hypothetical protein
LLPVYVGDDQVEPGTAERFDAAGFIDHVNREFRRGDAADADLRHAAGGGVERADIDGVGRPAAKRHGAEGAGCEQAARLYEKFAAAAPLRRGLIWRSPTAGGILACFVHAFSPFFGGGKKLHPPITAALSLFFPMVTVFKIVYNTVCNLLARDA